VKIVRRESSIRSFEEMLEDAKQYPEYYEEQFKLAVADMLIERMDTEAINKSELARRMRKSRSEVTKMLRGNHNLTVESLARIAFNLGYVWEPRLVRITRENVIDFEKPEHDPDYSVLGLEARASTEGRPEESASDCAA